MFDVDYHDKYALMNINLCIAMKHPRIALRETGSMNSIVADGCSKTRSVKGRSKTAGLLENIADVHELIMQDRHVTYREIETYFSISSTSIYSILHELSLNPAIAQKRLLSICAKKILEKYNGCASKDIYKIVTGDESGIYAYEAERKQ